jgi:quinol-cytochrome oxidoreductase complex cytochrome b subunit
VRYFLLGGNEIHQSALIRFYVLHVFFLPVIVLLLFFYHMWRIRKDGGLAVVDQEAMGKKPAPVEPVKSKTYSLLGITKGATVHVRTTQVDEEQGTVASVPNLVRRIWVVTLLTTIAVMILSFIFRAPLEAPADPSVTPNPAKAPWYFLWLQEVVTITTFSVGSLTINGALVGGILLPGILLFLAAWWPYRDRSGPEAVGVWFPLSRKQQIVVFLAICLLIVAFTFIGTFMRGPYWTLYWPWESWPSLPVRF